MTDVLIVLCTCPDAATARSLAGGLIGEKLAACVNILPEIRSIYRWEGDVRDDSESLLLAKTTGQAYARIESWLKDQHPYAVPEVLAFEVGAGSADYLEWVRN